MVQIVYKNVKSHQIKGKYDQNHAPAKDQGDFQFTPYELKSAEAYLIKMAGNSNLGPMPSETEGKNRHTRLCTCRDFYT